MTTLLEWIERYLLDRRVANRSMVLALLTLPMCFILWALQAYAQADPSAGVHYRAQPLSWAQYALAALMCWLVAVVLFALRLARQGRDATWLAKATVLPIFAVLVWVSIGYGLKDTPMGMVLIEELILTRALFPLRAIKGALWLSALMIVGNDLLIGLGWVSYAPMLSAPVFNGQALSWWWAVWLRIMFQASVVPFSAMLFFAFNTVRRQRTELESLVRTDALTGLFNRREFMTQLEQESHRHERSGRPFCLISCDVDHFKRVNDTWGHPAGDEVLVTLGQIFRSEVRPNIDTAARIGGEEFVLLMPDSQLPQAQMLAQQIARRLRAHDFWSEGSSFNVTLSIGITEVHGGQGEQALKLADQNLYAAKRAGRDQIVSAVLAGR